MPKLNYTEHDRPALKEIIKRMRDIPPQIEAIVEAMEIDGLDKITVTNYKSLLLGLQKLEAFSHELRRTYMDWKHDAGKFIAEGSEVPKLNETFTRNKPSRLKKSSKSVSRKGKK